MTETKEKLKAKSNFHQWSTDVLRYADTDRQGHINNAVFSVFLESGRVAMLYDPGTPLAPSNGEFVIVSLSIDFIAEIHWPGEVQIGTAVTRIGNTSFSLGQGIFVGDQCVAVGETTMVLINQQERRSMPLTTDIRDRLKPFALAGEDL